jgi:nucleotide-binding universal stress UspA family protein
MEPVLSSFAHTKSDAPQLEQTGATRSPSQRSDLLSEKGLHWNARRSAPWRTVRNRDVTSRPCDAMTPPEFKRIVAAIDGSAHGSLALDSAIDLTQRYGGQLTVLAVAPIQPVYVGPQESFGSTPTILSDRPRYQQYVEDAVHRTEQAGVTGVTGICLEGVIPDELLAFLEEHPTDLLVIGSRGLSTARRILLGSVSTAMVTHAPCPVLVVRTPPTKRGA